MKFFLYYLECMWPPLSYRILEHIYLSFSNYSKNINKWQIYRNFLLYDGLFYTPPRGINMGLPITKDTYKY